MAQWLQPCDDPVFVHSRNELWPDIPILLGCGCCRSSPSTPGLMVLFILFPCGSSQ